MKQLGIEIEFTGVKRDDVIKALENLFQTEALVKSNNKVDIPYNYYKIKDYFGNYWTIIRDRSVKSQVYSKSSRFELTSIVDNDFEYSCELVSPVLTSETLPVLFSIVDVIKASGGVVNNTCGIHVHVDIMPVEDIVNLYKRFVSEQDEIFNAFNVEDWRAEKYCKRYDSYIEVPKNFNSEEDFLYWIWCHYRDKEVDGDKEVRLSRSMRYYALNFYSLFQHNTIEYRLFNSTLDKVEIARILKWVISFTYPYEKLDDLSLVLEQMLLMEMVNKE